MTDQFATWTKLIAVLKPGMTVAAQREAMKANGFSFNDGAPISGYFRCAAVKNGPLLPVAIWTDEAGKLQILRSGQAVAIERVWPWCVTNPVPYEWYEAKVERGEPWPDEHVDVAEPGPKAAGQEAPLPGHNNPPQENEAAALKRQIETASANIAQYGKIDSEETAAAAQALRSRLNELSNAADKKREAEKRPHLDKCKEVDAKWQPLVKLAKDSADKIRRLLSDYATRVARDAADKTAEAAKKAASEQPAPLSLHDQLAGSVALAQEQSPAATVTPMPAATIKGASGRAARVTVKKIAKVVDYDQAFQHMKAFPDIKAAIDKAAQRMIDAGNDVPGVEIEERRDVA